MSKINILIKLSAILALSFLYIKDVNATHCYIQRGITETSTLITLDFIGVYQSPTPRVKLGYSIIGAWYHNTTEGGMDPGKCKKMLAYKAKNDANSWPNPGQACIISYSDDILVYTGVFCSDSDIAPPEPTPLFSIAGTWTRSDGEGQTVHFSANGIGVYTNPGTLQRFGFVRSETGFRNFRLTDNNGLHQGEVKWRWSGGRFEWRTGSFTVNGNQMTDAGGGNWYRISDQQVIEPEPQIDISLAGLWRRNDGDNQTLQFSIQGTGVYNDPGNLRRFGFSPNEVGFQNFHLTDQSRGTYQGEVKWRWAGGRFEWRSGSFTVQGDRMTDDGGGVWSRIR